LLEEVRLCNHEAMPLNVATMTRFEGRLCVFSFVRTLWFYMPVMVHHIVVELRAAGVEQPHALAMSTLVIFSLGILLAEYPSGVFADWAGRKHALVVSCLLHAAGMSIYAISSTLPAMFAGQLVLGLGAAFRSGADSSLLHSQLERAGMPERYSAALAYMRIATNGAIVVGCLAGGLLYAWWPPAVFIGTALCSLAALVPLGGLEEPPRRVAHRSYLDVLRQSLAEVRSNRPARAMMLLGGVGVTFFLFVFWTTQSYLVEIGAPVKHNGVLIGLTALLSVLSLTTLAWLSASPQRHGLAVGLLLFTIPLALLATAAAYRTGRLWLGAGCLIIIAMGQALFRNLANIRLQQLVPDAVRASLVSLESWIGSLLYVPVFPIGGALLDAWGIDGGYTAIAALVLPPSVVLYLLARRHGVWSSNTPCRR
jgi:MFS family permease